MMTMLVLVVMCLFWVQAPRIYTLDLANPNHIVGAYSPEPAGSWLRGDSLLMLPQTYFASMQILEMRWQRYSAAEEFTVTISQQTNNAVSTASSQLVPTPELRTMRYLLRAPITGGEMVRFVSPVQQFGGDKRAIGAMIRDVTVQVLPYGLVSFGIYVLSFWSVCVALAVWLRRSGWMGMGVWGMVVTLYCTVLWQELQSGFYQPYILFSPVGRMWFCGMLFGLVLWRALRPNVTSDAQPDQGRRLGLDVIRFFAITSVVIAHGVGLLPTELNRDQKILRLFISHGLWGVDMFFSLSGYLIGRIILRILESLNQYEVVRRFWMRRWLRTLPVAYISAAIIWMIVPPNSVMDYVQSILFLSAINPNNVIQEMGFWWSLGIEEVFYFLFPLVIYWLCRRYKMTPTQAFITAVVVFLVVPTLVRFTLQQILSPRAANNLNVSIYARLDSMVYGLMIAWMYIWRRSWFERVASWGFAPGIGIMLVGYLLTAGLDRWYMFGIFMGHTFMVCGSALLIPAMERVMTLGWKPLDRFVSWVALISYSMYLYHIMIYTVIKREFGSMPIFGELTWVGLFGVYLCVTGIVSWLSYRYVEAPILRWRDRHYPEIGRQAQE